MTTMIQPKQHDRAATNGQGRDVVNNTPLPSLWMSLVVERACIQIWNAWAEKSDVAQLRVNPEVYQAVARARPGEVSRGYPLMLLGLELVPDGAVRVYEPVVIRA
jgi:hypothetical protein